MRAISSRRRFLTAAVAAGGSPLTAQSPGRIRGFDHVALPMQNTDAMLAFYRGLGFLEDLQTDTNRPKLAA
jgi:hypothetical protein